MGVAALFDLTGKTAVVTGGTRGIGLMAARGLLQAGAKTYIASRDAAACEAAAKELAEFGEVVALPANLSTALGCTAFVEEMMARESSLDILVNNAGAAWGAPIESYPVTGWDKVMNLNLRAPFLLVQGFLPLLEKAGTASDPARVVNIGSIDGLRVPMLPTYAYSASKAGLHHLTRSLATTLGPSAITVNAIAPGPFESKMMAATLEAEQENLERIAPLQRIGEPDDIAGAVVYLASRGASYVTGVVLAVDGGISLVSAG